MIITIILSYYGSSGTIAWHQVDKGKTNPDPMLPDCPKADLSLTGRNSR
jgi:hypothetical protein